MCGNELLYLFVGRQVIFAVRLLDVSVYSAAGVLLRVAEFGHLFGLREEQDFLVKLQHPQIEEKSE
jgi:hypothetical protein